MTLIIKYLDFKKSFISAYTMNSSLVGFFFVLHTYKIFRMDSLSNGIIFRTNLYTNCNAQYMYHILKFIDHKEGMKTPFTLKALNINNSNPLYKQFTKSVSLQRYNLEINSNNFKNKTCYNGYVPLKARNTIDHDS